MHVLEPDREMLPAPGQGALALQCRHFVDCVTSGSEPVTGFEDAARVVEVLEAASASHANGGARVAIPDLR